MKTDPLTDLERRQKSLEDAGATVTMGPAGITHAFAPVYRQARDFATKLAMLGDVSVKKVSQ